MHKSAHNIAIWPTEACPHQAISTGQRWLDLLAKDSYEKWHAVALAYCET